MRTGTNRTCAALLVAMALVAAAGPAWAGADGETVTDEWCGFTATIGASWKRVPFRTFAVPGAIRCAWAGPREASVVIFVQEPGTAVDPRTILDASTAVQKDKLGATIKVQDVRLVGGMKAMWLVITGKGTGAAVDGKGEVETTQHWVAVPRERDVIVVLLTCREPDYAELQKSFESMVGSLKLKGTQTAEQKAAK